MHTSARVRTGLAAALAAALAAGAATAAPPLDPPRQYSVSGSGEMAVSGPGCCGDARFLGDFRAAYQVDSAGNALLTSLHLSVADTDATVRGGFLDLFSETLRLRCTTLGSHGTAAGFLAGSEVRFPAGAVRIVGYSSEQRSPDGACGDPTLHFDGSNVSLLRLVHEPAADRVGLDATFDSVAYGETYTITFRATGTFDNRPPLASLQFETAAAPQGLGCPAVYQPNQGFVAEANHPTGLRATLRASSGDPDGPPGAGSGADLLSQRWLRARDTGPRALIGTGYRTEPLTFEWGPTHFVDLVQMDRAGAVDAVQCAFRVVDSRPPLVTPPAPKTVACSQAGGASSSTSAAVAAFLAGASALDVVDSSLTALPPRLGSADVTPATLFPGDGAARNVTFRFRDDWGNVGSAVSSLTVTDGPPTLAVTLTPDEFAADGMWHWVNASISAQGCAAPVTLKLHKIVSNAPQLDADDIYGASLGTDDRVFALRGRLAPTGKRTYTVTYRATDAAGRTTTVSASVKAH